MSSLIADWIKPNMCFVSVKLFIVFTTYTHHVYSYLLTTFLQATYIQPFSQNNWPNFFQGTLLLYSAHNWDVQICKCFVHSQLHTRPIKLLLILFCFILPFYSPTRSIQRNVVEAEGSRTRLWEYSITTACIDEFSYLSVSHADVVGGLLINSWMYIGVSVVFVLFFLMLDVIRSFSICVKIFYAQLFNY